MYKNTLVYVAIFLMILSSMFLSWDVNNLYSKIVEIDEDDLAEVFVILKGRFRLSESDRIIYNSMSTEERQLFYLDKIKSDFNNRARNLINMIKNAEADSSAILLSELYLSNCIRCLAKKRILSNVLNDVSVDRILYIKKEKNTQSPILQKSTLDEPTDEIIWGIEKIGAPNVWDIGITGQNVTVAVFDGQFGSHSALNSSLWDGKGIISGQILTYHGSPLIHNGWDTIGDGEPEPRGDNNPYTDPPYNQHGTGVSGIIAADEYSGINVGVAPDAILILIRCIGEGEDRFMEGFNWITEMKTTYTVEFKFPEIINISGGLVYGQGPDYDTWRETCYNFWMASGKKVVVNAAVGNEQNHTGNGYGVKVPACIPSSWLHPDQPSPLQTEEDHTNCVLAVGATDQDDFIWTYSNYGPSAWEDIQDYDPSYPYPIREDYWDYPVNIGNNLRPLIKPDLTAPAGPLSPFMGDLWTTGPGDSWIRFGGTSAATPHVSGATALLFSANNYLESTDISRILQLTSIERGSDGKDNVYGAGRINAYQAVLMGLAYDGKSQYSVATYPNNARQLVKGGGYLHQIFFSGYEIFYRRQPEGEAWEDPVRISDGAGGYRYPCIAYGHNRVFVVWQRIYQQSGSYRFDIFFRSYDSTNGWSDQSELATGLAMSGYQAEPMPVLAFDPNSGSNGEIYAVYTCNQGLLYHTSSDYGVNWSSSPSTIISCNRVRYPSVSFNNDRMVVLYERRYKGIWSNYYNGSWSGEARVDTNLSISSTFTPSVTIDKDGKPHATWIAYPSGYGKYSIIFRRGNSNNTWNSTWTKIFPASNYSLRNPSISLYAFSQLTDNIIIAHHSDDNEVLIQYYEEKGGTWNETGISSSGKYPSISEEFEVGEYPIVHYTNQNQSPYSLETEVIGPWFAKRLFASDENRTSKHLKLVKRVGVFTNKSDNSRLILDIEPMTGILHDGTEVEIPFNFLPILDSVHIDLNNLGYYLGADEIKLMENLCDLKVNFSIRAVTESDSSGVSVKVIPQELYTLNLRIEESADKSNYILSNIRESAPVNIDIQDFSGKLVNITPVIQFKDGIEKDLTISVGNVYVSNAALIKRQSGDAIIAKENLPESYALLQNYPNPFNPKTTIVYRLPERAHVNLTIYDLQGKRVKELVNNFKNAGNYFLQWDGKNDNGNEVSSGIYVYSLQTKYSVFSKKMLLIR